MWRESVVGGIRPREEKAIWFLLSDHCVDKDTSILVIVIDPGGRSLWGLVSDTINVFNTRL